MARAWLGDWRSAATVGDRSIVPFIIHNIYSCGSYRSSYRCYVCESGSSQKAREEVANLKIHLHSDNENDDLPEESMARTWLTNG